MGNKVHSAKDLFDFRQFVIPNASTVYSPSSVHKCVCHHHPASVFLSELLLAEAQTTSQRAHSFPETIKTMESVSTAFCTFISSGYMG